LKSADSHPARPRIGYGYDVHRLAAGRRLILGGVEIPHDLGLDGHSDADVLVHAVADALLGAACLGDIGQHFPNTDARYRGISSLLLLKEVALLLDRSPAGAGRARIEPEDDHPATSTATARRPGPQPARASRTSAGMSKFA